MRQQHSRNQHSRTEGRGTVEKGRQSLMVEMTYRPADWDLGQGKKIFKSGLECRADGWMWQQKVLEAL